MFQTVSQGERKSRNPTSTLPPPSTLFSPSTHPPSPLPACSKTSSGGSIIATHLSCRERQGGFVRSSTRVRGVAGNVISDTHTPATAIKPLIPWLAQHKYFFRQNYNIYAAMAVSSYATKGPHPWLHERMRLLHPQLGHASHPMRSTPRPPPLPCHPYF